MTILIDNITDIAGESESTVTVWATKLREKETGDGITTTVRHDVPVVDGIFQTPDLDPGPAEVRIGLDTYQIQIPDSPSPIRLWPLIDAGMPSPPEHAPGWVRDGGGVARVEAVTMAEYGAMTRDPATMYIITDSSVGDAP